MHQADQDMPPRALVLEAAHPTDIDLPALMAPGSPLLAFIEADTSSDLLMLRGLRDENGSQIMVPRIQSSRVEHALNISRGVATERMFRLTYGLYAPGSSPLAPGVVRTLLMTRHLLVPALIENGTFLPARAENIERAKSKAIPMGPVIAMFDRVQPARCESAHQRMTRAAFLRSEIDLVCQALNIREAGGVAFC